MPKKAPSSSKPAPKLKILTTKYPDPGQVTCRGCLRVIKMTAPMSSFDCPCGKTLELVSYRPVHRPEELERWLADYCVGAPSTSFDYETTGLDVFRSRIVGVSFCPEHMPGEAIYVPVFHRVGENMDFDAMKAIVAPFIEKYPVNAHNASFEFKVSVVHLGVEPFIVCDTMLESWMDDLNRASRFDARSIGLKEMAQEVFSIETTELDQLVDLKRMDFSFVPVNMAYQYGCQDADLTTRLKRKFCARNSLPINEGGQSDIRTLEHAIIEVTAHAELRGITVDLDRLAEAGPVLHEELDKVQAQIDALAGEPVDLGSPEQVANFLFRKLNVPYDEDFVGKPTKGWPDGMPSTSKKALDLVREEFEAVDLVMTAREIRYAIENYVEKLPHMVRPDTGTLHCNLNQAGTPTGRYSSSKPNLQAVAKLRD